MNEVLTLDIIIMESVKVKGNTAEAEMFFFGGSCNCENFNGVILPGGIDTQMQRNDENRTLSARYILEGTDCVGESCKIFIENNAEIAENGVIEKTNPVIITDSKALSYLETAELYGRVSFKEDGICIHIYMD